MKHFLFLLGLIVLLSSCKLIGQDLKTQVAHQDTVFLQEKSIKYDALSKINSGRVRMDRNGNIRMVYDGKLYQPANGHFLYPGKSVKDLTYLPISDSTIISLEVWDGQFYYLTPTQVISNHYGGVFEFGHQVEAPIQLVLGEQSFALVTALKTASLFQNGQLVHYFTFEQEVLEVVFDPIRTVYWVLTMDGLYELTPPGTFMKKQIMHNDLLAMAVGKDHIYLGTTNGLLTYDIKEEALGEEVFGVPASPVHEVAIIGDQPWYGTPLGAFKPNESGGFDYYAGKRWLPGNQVLDIAEGPDSSVLVLTDRGLAKLEFGSWTLSRKAQFYEQQVRQRHIRYGFNATLGNLKGGDLATGILKDSDNDGLWTSMYLAGQAFRYGVTQSPEALQNCWESLAAMERLFTINPVAGFPSRSYERAGYREILADPERWQPSPEQGWDWKATTSSDEAIGHMFAYGVIADVVADTALRNLAISLMDQLMTHIVQNDWYLMDYDGKPTTWGRWNPDYVNGLPTMVGDRKLNSSNIISMLQTAYHYTGKKVFKSKAFELMEHHGYLENLLRPMSEIGQAPDDADDWSKMLSSSWNHSDDEMYFLGYWGLYHYAFNDSLKALYREAILDHWQFERPEKEGAWNIFTAMVGVPDFDLEEAIWYLQEYPLDLINWSVKNSHRQDLTFLKDNFRRQTTSVVLPPDERPIQRHNGNTFTLDRNSKGTAEYSAGDIWLLPYWMGRYLGVIR